MKWARQDLARNDFLPSRQQSQLGRPVTQYGGIPIGVVVEDHTNTDILAFDEDHGSSNLDTTSINGVRMGFDGVHGIQTRPIDVCDLGELDTKSVFRTRIEWNSAIVVKHPEAAARLIHLNNAC